MKTKKAVPKVSMEVAVDLETVIRARIALSEESKDDSEDIIEANKLFSELPIYSVYENVY